MDAKLIGLIMTLLLSAGAMMPSAAAAAITGGVGEREFQLGPDVPCNVTLEEADVCGDFLVLGPVDVAVPECAENPSLPHCELGIPIWWWILALCVEVEVSYTSANGWEGRGKWDCGDDS